MVQFNVQGMSQIAAMGFDALSKKLDSTDFMEALSASVKKQNVEAEATSSLAGASVSLGKNEAAYVDPRTQELADTAVAAANKAVLEAQAAATQKYHNEKEQLEKTEMLERKQGVREFELTEQHFEEQEAARRAEFRQLADGTYAMTYYAEAGKPIELDLEGKNVSETNVDTSGMTTEQRKEALDSIKFKNVGGVQQDIKVNIINNGEITETRIFDKSSVVNKISQNVMNNPEVQKHISENKETLNLLSTDGKARTNGDVNDLDKQQVKNAALKDVDMGRML